MASRVLHGPTITRCVSAVFHVRLSLPACPFPFLLYPVFGQLGLINPNFEQKCSPFGPFRPRFDQKRRFVQLRGVGIWTRLEFTPKQSKLVTTHVTAIDQWVTPQVPCLLKIECRRGRLGASLTISITS